MGVAVVVMLGSGTFLAGKLERDSRARVADYAAAAPVDDAPEPSEEDDRAFAEQAFDKGVLEDAKALGVAISGVEPIYAAQAHVVELQEPVVLGPGKSWSSERLEVSAATDKVKYQKHGATVSARHSIAVVKNISDAPLAYHVRVSSDARGRCDVHGARQHNAMALMPGEKAEIVVCAGGGKIRVLHAETLQISELGHRYLSRVPPRAAGVGSLSSHAHAPPKGSKLCETVDVAGLSLAIREGTARWVDIVDYYSRHSCDRFRFFPAYRHTGQPLAKLPVQPAAE
jgi:hypothetical protein